MDNPSYLKSFLLIYLVSLSGFMSTLVNDELKQKIMESRIAQHIIGLITVLVMINLLGVDKLEILLPSTLLVYVGFLLTTKLSLNINMLVLILFLLSYLTEITFNRKIKQLKNDPFVNENIIKKHNRKQNKIRLFIGSVIGIVIVYGVTIKFKNKETELQGGFNPIRFFTDGKENGFNLFGGGDLNYKI